MSCCDPVAAVVRLPEMRQPLWLFYDAQCGMCTRSVAWAQSRDRLGLILPHPSLSAIAAEKLGLPEPRPLGALHAWSQERGVVRGIDAVAAMLRRLPGWHWAGALLRFPLVRPFARLGYGFVAANRHRFGAPVECRIPPTAGNAPRV